MQRRIRFPYTSAFVIASAFIIGGLMGWIGGSYITPVERTGNVASNFVPGIGGGPEVAGEVVPYTTTISDFRVQLNSLLKEHTVVASQYLQNLYDGKDTSALKNQLNQNTNLLADIVGKMYGNDAKDEFINSWNQHIALYESYTRALKNGDENGKENAHNSLFTLSSKMGEAMQKMDRNFSQARITDLMDQHIRFTLETIDAYAASDSARVADTTKRAYDQAGEFADYLGQAIAASHPNILQ